MEAINGERPLESVIDSMLAILERHEFVGRWEIFSCGIYTHWLYLRHDNDNHH